MKKITSLSIVMLMFAAVIGLSSCFTSATLEKQFIKKGYTMGTYTWNDMCTVCPFLVQVPSFEETAKGFIIANDVYTFVYECDQNTISAYCSKLLANGYSKISDDVYTKTSGDKTFYYKVKFTHSELNKESYYLVGFSEASL